MKKVLMAFCFALACSAAVAQEAAAAPAAAAPAAEVPAEKAPWPVWLAFNSAKDVDVVGFRMNLFYGSCDSVTGFDLGFYGKARYFEGAQLNLLRNEAEDVLAGVQLGIYNTAGDAEAVGAQVGLFNEARTIRGFQVGLFNVANQVRGIQVGLINRTSVSYGFQVGAVNVIRESELQCFPVLNIGFDEFPNY